MEEHGRFLEARQKDVTDSAKEIHGYLKDSVEVLKVSKGAPAWRAYVEYMNNILVTEGLKTLKFFQATMGN